MCVVCVYARENERERVQEVLRDCILMFVGETRTHTERERERIDEMH